MGPWTSEGTTAAAIEYVERLHVFLFSGKNLIMSEAIKAWNAQHDQKVSGHHYFAHCRVLHKKILYDKLKYWRKIVKVLK